MEVYNIMYPDLGILVADQLKKSTDESCRDLSAQTQISDVEAEIDAVLKSPSHYIQDEAFQQDLLLSELESNNRHSSFITPLLAGQGCNWSRSLDYGDIRYDPFPSPTYR